MVHEYNLLAKAAAMWTALPPILLAQNLSSKWIAPTDNMQPKLHDEYTCHQVN